MTTSCLGKRNPGRTCCLCFLFSVNSPQLNAKTASTQEVLHLCFRCSPPREARRIVLKIPLTAGGANAASHGVAPPPPPHGHAAWWGHAVRAQRFPHETQAGAGIGKADRASSGGRGSNVSRSASLWAAQPHEGASEPVASTCCRPMPEQCHTSRTTPPTLFRNRAQRENRLTKRCRR